jgi:hypothetical protein
MGKGEAIPSHDIKVLGGMFNDLTLGDTPNIMGKGASHPMTLRFWVAGSMISHKICVQQTHFGHYYKCMIIIGRLCHV